MSWKSRLSYRGAFYFRTASIGFGYVVQVTTIWILVSRFESIAGWSAWEVAFLYGMHLLAYALGASFFYHPSTRMHQDILSGEFDTYMIRPIGPMAYYIAKNFATGYVTHISIGVAILAISWSKLSLSWTTDDTILLITIVIGSSIIMGSLQILPALVSFWVPKSENLVNLVFWTSREFMNYPIDIFAKPIRFILIYAIPMAFVNYFPAHIFLEKPLPFGYPTIFRYLSPAVGVILLLITIACTRVSIRHYKSSGS
jgi:ABC-2 type transport system permease protein